MCVDIMIFILLNYGIVDYILLNLKKTGKYLTQSLDISHYTNITANKTRQ